jgi:replication factor A1
MCQIQDHSGSSYATAFHEAAEEIIGHKAQELFNVKNVEEDEAKVEEIVRGILWNEYVFKLRAKEAAGHGVKLGIVKAEKLDPSNVSRHVLGEIDNILAQGIMAASVGHTNLEAQTYNSASGSMTMYGTSSMIQ